MNLVAQLLGIMVVLVGIDIASNRFRAHRAVMVSSWISVRWTSVAIAKFTRWSYRRYKANKGKVVTPLAPVSPVPATIVTRRRTTVSPGMDAANDSSGFSSPSGLPPDLDPDYGIGSVISE